MAHDPWAVPRPAGRTLPPATWPVLAVALGVAGPVARHLGDDFGRRAVLVAVVGAAMAVVCAAARTHRGGPAAVALVGVLFVALSPTGAHRATAVAVAGVVVADAALVGWRPWPRWPARRVPRVGLAVAPVVFAGVLWYRHGPLLLVVLLLLAGLCVVEAHHRWPAPAEGVARAVDRTLDGLGRVVSTAIVLVVALPLVYLPGTLVAVLARLRPDGASTWVARAVGPDQDVAAARRPFSPVPIAVRRRRNLAGLGVLAAAVVVSAGVLVWRDGRTTPGPPPAATGDEGRPGPDGSAPPSATTAPATFSDLPAYRGVDFADALQAEQRELSGSLRTDAVTVTAVPDLDGTYTDVSDGVRRTLVPSCGGCAEVSMWWVGGSVAFGLGQRDEHTVASELVRLAAADDIALRVTNLAVPGWTVWQERAAVVSRLEAGEPPADVVVSLSGYNDAAATLLSGAVRDGDLPVPTLLRQDDLEAFLADDRSAADGGGVDALSTEAVARYGAIRDDLAQDLEARGVAFRSFFQADALADPDQLEPVRHVNPGIPGRVVDDLAALLAATATGVAPGTVDLRDTYGATDASVFVDWSHTNEEGARVAAVAVYERLGPVLARLAR